ncbi:MAG: Ig-like domain-containing protein, partial [Lachnospiraceae bacterium]|nr:Ig-like domain-containing protein [Lachnospiraceae bacterium]
MGEFFSRFSTLDKIVAGMGCIVAIVAVLTIFAYTGNHSQNKQVEAMAPIGLQMENVGIIGMDKLLAVADAQKAMFQAIQLEEELSPQYEEKEVSKEIQVAMKMTSVQRDLKIKFVNKKTGKLVSSIPFEVEITDGSGKKYNKIDEDKDGIIYLKDLEPGNYTVTMVKLDNTDGYSFSTSEEKIKVKDKIDYEKIDVSDEIKDQSEVDVAKEDTAKKQETEAVLQNTVEWVESRKEAVSSQETYTKVEKNTIADPALSASLSFDHTVLKLMKQGIFLATVAESVTEGTPSEGETNPPTGEETPSTEEVTPPQEGDNITPPKENETPPAEIDKVKAIDLTASEENVEEGKMVTFTAKVEKEGNPSYTLEWSVAGSDLVSLNVAGETASLTVTKAPEQDTTITVTVKAGAVSASKNVTVKAKPKEVIIPVTKIELDSHAITLEVEKSHEFKVTVLPDNAANKNYTWSVADPQVAKIENNKVTALKAGTTKITVTSAADGTIKAECTVTAVAKVETTIKLDKTSAVLKPKETLQLNATVTPEGKTIKWASSKTEVATVDDKGKVTAVAAGETVITAESEGKKAECKITVNSGYDPKTDTTKLLKDKSGNQIYVMVNGAYVEAKVADYYKYDTFYKKENVSSYRYYGWQNLDGKSYFFDKNGNKVTGEQVIQGAKYNFNSDGSLNTGSGVLGIDVSTWNGNINWNQVKNSGVSYVIIRTGFRGSTQGALVEDNKFRQNIQGAINAGLKVGVYFFTQAVNEVEAVEEASMVLSQIKGYKITYPVFIDVEGSGGRADGLDAGTRTRIINAFCQTIQNGGYRAGIYANKTWLAQKMNVSALSGYKIWLAQYNTQVTYGGRYDMWQYSDKGKISGISGNVDMNLSFMNY